MPFKFRFLTKVSTFNQKFNFSAKLRVLIQISIFLHQNFCFFDIDFFTVKSFLWQKIGVKKLDPKITVFGHNYHFGVNLNQNFIFLFTIRIFGLIFDGFFFIFDLNLANPSSKFIELDYNHLDFLWATNVKSTIYDIIINKVLEQ